MRYRIFLIILTIIISLSFCSKKSTDPIVEDNISIEIVVLENGLPAANLFVFIEAKVKESVKSIDTGNIDADKVEDLEATQTDQLSTNQYGKAVFSYKNKSLSTPGGIYIEKITIKRGTEILYEDSESKFVRKNESKTFQYEI